MCGVCLCGMKWDVCATHMLLSSHVGVSVRVYVHVCVRVCVCVFVWIHTLPAFMCAVPQNTQSVGTDSFGNQYR